MQWNIKKKHNLSYPVQINPTCADRHLKQRSAGFISIRICSVSSARRSGIWLWHSRGAAVTWLSSPFKRFQRLGMITAHGAISQYTTGLYLDHLCRSITGSSPNNIALFVPFCPGFYFQRLVVFFGQSGGDRTSKPLSLSLSPSVRCSERQRESWKRICGKR